MHSVYIEVYWCVMHSVYMEVDWYVMHYVYIEMDWCVMHSVYIKLEWLVMHSVYIVVYWCVMHSTSCNKPCNVTVDCNIWLRTDRTSSSVIFRSPVNCRRCAEFTKVQVAAKFPAGFRKNKYNTNVGNKTQILYSLHLFARPSLSLSTWNNSYPTGRNLKILGIWILFKICKKNWFSLKSIKFNWILTSTLCSLTCFCKPFPWCDECVWIISFLHKNNYSKFPHCYILAYLWLLAFSILFVRGGIFTYVTLCELVLNICYYMMRWRLLW